MPPWFSSDGGEVPLRLPLPRSLVDGNASGVTGGVGFGVFSVDGDEPRVGFRVGHGILDLAAQRLGAVFEAADLNPFLALGRSSWEDTLARIDRLVGAGADLVPLEDATLRLPFAVRDYVDFYSSLEHATNLGRLFRPDGDPLLPNWRHLPVGYHGRAGTVVVSGTPVVRPRGQTKAPVEDEPRFGPSARLDIELELGFVVGVGSDLGEPVPASAFRDHVFGVVLVNDWSARDIQAWEYQPLGPFLGKSFATSIAAWVTPLALLEDRFVPAPRQDPEPLGYLRTGGAWGIDVELEVELSGTVVSRTNARGLYWTMPQQLAHATVNGASVETGDLFASGTISGPEHGSEGSLIELTSNGEHPIGLADGSTRAFLEDGDEVVLRGRAGELELGEVRGVVLPARV
jgi:fumarylacetoacetase